jgi:tetratricopeptide (TPR) repeat protein
LLSVATAAAERAAAKRAASGRSGVARTAVPAAPHRSRRPGLDALIAARAAWAEGRYEQVVELAGRAAHADPLLTDAYVLRGQAWSTMGDDAHAVDALRKAVYLDAVAGHAHFLLAGALSRLGQPDAAARSFRAAAASLPLVSAEQVRFLLDGREVGELVVLCETLADASERAARAASASERSSS